MIWMLIVVVYFERLGHRLHFIWSKFKFLNCVKVNGACRGIQKQIGRRHIRGRWPRVRHMPERVLVMRKCAFFGAVIRGRERGKILLCDRLTCALRTVQLLGLFKTTLRLKKKKNMNFEQKINFISKQSNPQSHSSQRHLNDLKLFKLMFLKSIFSLSTISNRICWLIYKQIWCCRVIKLIFKEKIVYNYEENI